MNGNNSMAVNLVATRGNRVTATILGAVEGEIYAHYKVPTDVQKKFARLFWIS